MSKLILAVVVVAASVFAASMVGARAKIEEIRGPAMTRPSQNESSCLDFGEMAQSAVAAQKRGASEKAILKIARESSTDAQVSAIAVSATRFALTIGAPADVARALVYSKCVAGDYDNVQVAAS